MQTVSAREYPGGPVSRDSALPLQGPRVLSLVRKQDPASCGVAKHRNKANAQLASLHAEMVQVWGAGGPT